MPATWASTKLHDITMPFIVQYHTLKHPRHSIFLLGSPSRRPIPDTSDWDLQMKREWLHKETQVFLDEVFLRTSVPENVIMLEEAFKQGFTCREAECGMQFPLHSTRVRY